MEGITPDELMRAAQVVLALFAALITVDKGIDIVKKWRAPSTDIAKKLDTDKRRLDTHDKAIGDLQSGYQALCAGVLALLDHELHNGNADQMEKAKEEIMRYLQTHIGH